MEANEGEAYGGGRRGLFFRVLLELLGSFEFCSKEGSVQGAPVY
jgi:hypothetical protein